MTMCLRFKGVLLLALCASACADTFDSELHRFDVETVVEGLQSPWGLAFLPGGDILVTERPGRLRVVRDQRLLEEPVAGLPAIREVGQGGLLGIALHPRFAENRPK